MGLITLVQPDEQFWLMVAVDDNDPTEVKHKICDDHEPTAEELVHTFSDSGQNPRCQILSANCQCDLLSQLIASAFHLRITL